MKSLHIERAVSMKTNRMTNHIFPTTGSVSGFTIWYVMRYSGKACKRRKKHSVLCQCIDLDVANTTSFLKNLETATSLTQSFSVQEANFCKTRLYCKNGFIKNLQVHVSLICFIFPKRWSHTEKIEDFLQKLICILYTKIRHNRVSEEASMGWRIFNFSIFIANNSLTVSSVSITTDLRQMWYTNYMPMLI